MHFSKRSFYSLLLALALPLFARAEHGEHSGSESSAESGVMTQDSQDLSSPIEAFERLQAGNQRFREGKPLHRDYVAQRKATAHGQYPFACILSCMDSRVSSEIIFDAGLGDIFNVRIAGNVVNDDVLGSLEYAHKAAGAKLLIILGHSSCGAVKGAADDVVMGNLTGLVARIRPAVAAIPPDGTPRNSRNHPFIDKVARMNVIYTVRTIRERSPILRELQDRGKIDIIGAFYDLETGKVEFYRPLSGKVPERAKPAPAEAAPEESSEHSSHAEKPSDEASHEKGQASHETHAEKETSHESEAVTHKKEPAATHEEPSTSAKEAEKPEAAPEPSHATHESASEKEATPKAEGEAPTDKADYKELEPPSHAAKSD